MANSSIFLGNSVVDTLYKGDKQIEAIYKGEYQIYSLGEFAGLRITKNLKFGIGGGKANLSLKSSEDWTLATDAEWLHLSSTGGTAGNYKIEVSADENGDVKDRTAEIIASSATYSAVCQVVQYYVQQVSYVYATQNPTTRNMTTAPRRCGGSICALTRGNLSFWWAPPGRGSPPWSTPALKNIFRGNSTTP